MRLRHLAAVIGAAAVVLAAAVTPLIGDLGVRVLAYLVIAVGAGVAVGLLLVLGQLRTLRRLVRNLSAQHTSVDAGTAAIVAQADDLAYLRHRLDALSRRLPDGTSPLVTRTELHTRTSWLLRRTAETVALGTRQTDALLNLHAAATPRVPLVPSDGWAASPDLLALLVHLVVVHRPRVVVELGGGTSTVWLGYVVERYGGRVVSLDHDAGYAEVTRRQIAQHELTSTVEIHHAPLVDTTAGAWTGRYYDLACLGSVASIDLLVVDGPPGDLQSRSREPAVPLLADRLTPGAHVVLDDAGRDDEAEIAARWAERDDVTIEREFRHFASRPVVLRRSAD